MSPFVPELSARPELYEEQAARAVELPTSHAPAAIAMHPIQSSTTPQDFPGGSSAVPPIVSIAGTLPQIAEDTDLIEKEWVLKAKEIVARTQHDPYQQNKEVEKIKADYLKKRYNKDVKVTED